MKKRILPIFLVLILLLSACGIDLGRQTPAAPSEAPQPGTAEIQMYRTSESDASESESTDAEAEAPAPDGEETPASTPAIPEEIPAADLGNTAVLDVELVRVLNYMPDLLIDLRYAGTDNFTGEVVYGIDEPYLRLGTVRKLIAAQSMLREQGYELLLWDAFRPPEAQFVLFDAHPNGNDVANPYGGGHSSHSSGGAVDVTLMKNGEPVEMPSDFDDFTALGDRDYTDVSAEAASHARLLEKVMTACGFVGYSKEWWHFSDTTGYNYADVESAVLPARATRVYESVCNEYINIRRVANPTAEPVGNVPNGEHMTVLSYLSGFAHIQYGETTGYVNSFFIEPVY